MLKVSDLEEKKLIVAFSMARDNTHVGLENVWRRWCVWWKEDFSVNGGALKMYDHRFVKSTTKARERRKAGETNIQDFKEYDDFLAEICKWLEENYDKTIGRKENTAILRDKLQKYKADCDKNIHNLLKKSGLKKKGYRLKNHTSRHLTFMGKYLIFHRDQNGNQDCVAQGTYEQVTNWIKNKIEGKDEK